MQIIIIINPKFTSDFLMGCDLEMINQDRNVRVVVDASMCRVLVNKDNSVIGIIGKGLKIREPVV